MPLRASVAGASGYAGGELLRLISGHPHLTLATVAAGSAAGQPVTDLHPQLPFLADREFARTDPEALSACDILFLALPHGQSAELVRDLPAELPVIDLGADFRLADPAQWQNFYGGAHAGQWPYGLPELFREQLRRAERVANPGCYPTAVALALAPLLEAGLIEGADLVVVAASGTSGAGRQPSSALLGSEVMADLVSYKVGAHQHTPEMTQTLQCFSASPGVSLSFTPMLAPMARGILATCTARTSATAVQLRAALLERYANEPFVHVLPEGRWPHTAATLGSNACQLQVTVDARAGRAVVVAAIDNLGKGAAGQAVQCANLALGLEETSGLTAAGVAP